MMLLQTLKACSVLLIAVSTASLAGQTSVSVAWPETAAERSAHQSLLRAGTLERLVDIADRYTSMKGDLSVVVDGSAESGFDPSTNTIVLSYGHWQQALLRAAAVGRTGDISLVTEFADDAMLYSAVHQLAHAVMAQQDPATQLLGEDAVSDLATVILLELVPDGARVAQNAMYLYDDSIAVSGEDRYWLDHGHSIERVWSGTCHQSVEADAESREICQDNYQQMVASWANVFTPEQAERMIRTAKRDQ